MTTADQAPKTIQLWLDDVRPVPDETWTLVTTPEVAIALLEDGNVVKMSLDHDLGLDDNRTGYTVLQWLEEAVVMRGFTPPSTMDIHSANPPARVRMEQALAAIRRMLKKREREGLPPMTPGERLKAAFSGEGIDDRKEAWDLLCAIKTALPELEKLLTKSSSHWGYEDMVYRFYHQSFKVYGLQHQTEEIVKTLATLAPERPMNEWFTEIVAAGTGKQWKREDNGNWLAVTRPMVEAFFHARYFLEMIVSYGRELETPPNCLPSGWAAVLYLYNLR